MTKTLGQIAYEAWCDKIDDAGIGYDGFLPYSELGDTVTNAWENAAYQASNVVLNDYIEVVEAKQSQ